MNEQNRNEEFVELVEVPVGQESYDVTEVDETNGLSTAGAMLLGAGLVAGAIGLKKGVSWLWRKGKTAYQNRKDKVTEQDNPETIIEDGFDFEEVE